jgi:hypothetical protein
MMMKKILLVTAALASLSLTACGNLNSYIADKSETVELYHVFDDKTSASVDTIINAATEGITRNTNNIKTNRPLNMHASKTLPATPGRFDVIDPMDTLKTVGGFGAFAALAQNNAGQTTLKQAKCDGAVWTAKAVRDIPGSNRLDMYVCIYPYVKGYQIDVYANFAQVDGGLMSVVHDAAYKLAGTPEEWVNKTIVDTMRSIETATHGKVTHVEGQPEIGNLPWTDKFDAASK